MFNEKSSIFSVGRQIAFTNPILQEHIYASTYPSLTLDRKLRPASLLEPLSQSIIKMFTTLAEKVTLISALILLFSSPVE